MLRLKPKLVFAISALLALPAAIPAQSVVDEWVKVVPPAAPALKTVTVEAKDTALLVLDFSGAQDSAKGPCNRIIKPCCLASIPRVTKLLAAAREKGMLIVYSVTSGGTPADIATAISPYPSDPVVTSGPDKFIGTNLGSVLEARHVKTVIITGTGAEGAVLDTAIDAALHGINVVVPVDGMSSTNPYAEQYVAWHLTHAPGMSPRVTLTRISLITVEN